MPDQQDNAEAFTTADALEEYDSWQEVLRVDTDDYDASKRLVGIFRQALIDPTQTIVQALGRAYLED